MRRTFMYPNHCLSWFLLGIAMFCSRHAKAAEDPAAMFPAEVLYYMQWPGIEVVSAAARETELAGLLAEPEMQRFLEQTGPALTTIQTLMAGMDPQAAGIRDVIGLLGALWRYPAAGALHSVSGGGMVWDMAVVIQAGEQSGAVLGHLESLIGRSGESMEDVRTVELGDLKFMELSPFGPAMPLRWGTVGANVFLSVGPTFTALLAETQRSPRLPSNPRFAAARRQLEVTATDVMFFVDLAGVVSTLEKLQPTFAEQDIPVLGELGGLNRLLRMVNMNELRSCSTTIRPSGEGFRSITWLHCPGLGRGERPLLPGIGVTDADLQVIPREVSFADIFSIDPVVVHDLLMDLLGHFDSQAPAVVADILAEAEKTAGVRVRDDLLASFGPRWTVYDAPSCGGLLVTGITVLNRLPEGRSPAGPLEALLSAALEKSGLGENIQIRKETHRGSEIRYANFIGWPVPVAPAWAEHKGYLIAALYPQMVRMAIDQLDQPVDSLLDNADFLRCRRQVLKDAFTLCYSDTMAGVRMFYQLGLPLSQALLGMGQGIGMPMDVSALPSLGVIRRHMLGTVVSARYQEDGMLMQSWGALPMNVGSLSSTTAVVPLLTSAMLPVLTHTRELSQRAWCAGHLKMIGTAMYSHAVEHDDRFPASLQELVDGGLLTPETLVSPGERHGRGCSYYLIPGTHTDLPSGSIVAFEYPDNFGGAGSVALFADGHVEWLTLPDLRRGVARTFEELNRPVPPDLRTMLDEAEEEDLAESDGGEDLLRDRRPREAGNMVEPADPAAPSRNKVIVARNMVGAGGPLGRVLETYRQHTGRFPDRLSDLIDRPRDPDIARKWQGPYVTSSDRLKDPWNQQLRYLPRGVRNPEGYDLWSIGPDGEDDTADDIGNWPAGDE